MTIRPQFGGAAKSVDESTGILWYAEADTVDETFLQSVLDADFIDDVEGLVSAGGISTEGVTITPSDSSSGNNTLLRSFNQDVWQTLVEPSEGDESDTIAFGLLEYLGVDAMKLVYKNVIPKVDSEGKIDRIEGSSKPTPKFIVVEFTIGEEEVVREIFPYCTFGARSEYTTSLTELVSQQVTYNIGKPKYTGEDWYRISIT